MKIDVFLKQLEKSALDDGFDLKITASKNIDDIKKKKDLLLEEYFFFDKDYIFYQYCRLNEKFSEFYDLVFNFKDLNYDVFSFGLSIVCDNDKVIVKNRGGDLIPFVPTISKKITKNCLKKYNNFFFKVIELLKKFIGHKLKFQSKLISDLTTLNHLSHFLQKSEIIILR